MCENGVKNLRHPVAAWAGLDTGARRRKGRVRDVQNNSPGPGASPLWEGARTRKLMQMESLVNAMIKRRKMMGRSTNALTEQTRFPSIGKRKQRL